MEGSHNTIQNWLGEAIGNLLFFSKEKEGLGYGRVPSRKAVCHTWRAMFEAAQATPNPLAKAQYLELNAHQLRVDQGF